MSCFHFRGPFVLLFDFSSITDMLPISLDGCRIEFIVYANVDEYAGCT
jgi:hypothetical protein